MHRKQGLSLSVHVDDITMAGRKQNFNPMWKKLMKLHHFLTTSTWDVLNVNANLTNVLLRNTKRCSNRESSLGQLKSYSVGRNLTRKQSLGLMTHGGLVCGDGEHVLSQGRPCILERTGREGSRIQAGLHFASGHETSAGQALLRPPRRGQTSSAHLPPTPTRPLSIDDKIKTGAAVWRSQRGSARRSIVGL